MLQDLRYAVRCCCRARCERDGCAVAGVEHRRQHGALQRDQRPAFMRKLQVDDPDSLVRFRHAGRNQMANNISAECGNINRDAGVEMGSTFSQLVFQELRKANQTLTDLAAGAPLGSVNVVVDGHAEIATAYLATGNLHQLLDADLCSVARLFRLTMCRVRLRRPRSARHFGRVVLRAIQPSWAR